MRRGRASRTALGVALFRAVATDAELHAVRDPIAASLLPRPLVPLARALARAPTLARAVSGGLLDHVALRTAAIDRALAALEPIAQLVILGAGFDARAFRLPSLAEAIVFEVDVRATQRLKKRRLARRNPLAREVRFVEVDFARGELAHRLAEAGHDPERPTVWLWEGVTPYLERSAVAATLATLSARSAPGSTLLVTYVTPDHVRLPAIVLHPVRRAFAALGEPLVGAIATSDLHTLLAAHGFEVEADTGSPDWAHHLAEPAPPIEIRERLARATRRP